MLRDAIHAYTGTNRSPPSQLRNHLNHIQEASLDISSQGSYLRHWNSVLRFSREQFGTTPHPPLNVDLVCLFIEHLNFCGLKYS